MADDDDGLVRLSKQWVRAYEMWRRAGNDTAARICRDLAESYYDLAADRAVDAQVARAKAARP